MPYREIDTTRQVRLHVELEKVLCKLCKDQLHVGHSKSSRNEIQLSKTCRKSICIQVKNPRLYHIDGPNYLHLLMGSAGESFSLAHASKNTLVNQV